MEAKTEMPRAWKIGGGWRMRGIYSFREKVEVIYRWGIFRCCCRQPLGLGSVWFDTL